MRWCQGVPQGAYSVEGSHCRGTEQVVAVGRGSSDS